MRILAFVTAMIVSVGAQAALLRTITTLHGPNVYLKDLFDDAGPNADRVLGSGPAPGGRIIVEAAQLNAIASQYAVAWRSTSRGDRAVLEWPGRPLRRDEVIDAVRAAITATGASDDLDIDLPGFTAPLVPADAKTAATVSQLDYDANTGRFTAALTVTGDGINPIDTRVSGRADAMVEAPVPVMRLPADAVVRPEDVRMARVRTAFVQNEIARSFQEIVGMQLRRPVAPGQPLRLEDLTRPPMVQRGSLVRVELASAGLSIIGQAVALQSGADGEKIRVQNTASHALLFAQVVGLGQVRVTPDQPASYTTAPTQIVREANGQ